MGDKEPPFSTNALSDSSSVYLDGARALLAQAVLIGHAASFYGVLGFAAPPHFPWLQSIAVVGFFWLSGFLICHSVLIRKQRMGKYRFSDFFFDRFSRIYSAYIPSMLLVLIVDLFCSGLYPEKYGFHRVLSFEVAIKNVFMLQKFPIDFIYSPMFGSASTWWTLAIEWWLYMFFGWVVLRRKEKPNATTFIIVLIFFSIVPLHFSILGTGHVGVGLALIWFMACCFALCKDYVCAVLSRNELVIGALLFSILALVRYEASMNSYDFIAGLCFGLSFLFTLCVMQGLTRKLSSFWIKLTRFFAKYSFTLFLTHYSLLYFVKLSGIIDGWTAFLTMVVICNLVAAASAVGTEFHYRKLSVFLKKKWSQVRDFRNKSLLASGNNCE